MKDIKKLRTHPDREEITRRLTEGESVRSLNKWLSGKYRQFSKHLRISIPTLQLFRKEVLKIDGKVLKEIQDIRKDQDRLLEAKYVQQAIEGTNAYQDKLNKVADTHLDVASKILQMDAIIGDRLEFWFNLIKSGQDLPNKADYELRKYIDQQVVVLQQYKKLVEGMADKKIDYNVNITVMNEQILAIQSTIRELICEELGPEKAISFLDKLSNRLAATQGVKELSAPKITDIVFESE